MGGLCGVYKKFHYNWFIRTLVHVDGPLFTSVGTMTRDQEIVRVVEVLVVVVITVLLVLLKHFDDIFNLGIEVEDHSFNYKVCLPN